VADAEAADAARGAMKACSLIALLIGAGLAFSASAAGFGEPGGPEPVNIAEVGETLRRDPYDLELMISFGTSKGGSAGHLALAIRDGAPDDFVYSANFYADRSEEHAKGFYNADLMVRIPKLEYLFGTKSTVGTRRRSAWTLARSTSAPSSAFASTESRPRTSRRSSPTSRASTRTTAAARRTPSTTTAR
jgi:hypothetical protein